MPNQTIRRKLGAKIVCVQEEVASSVTDLVDRNFYNDLLQP